MISAHFVPGMRTYLSEVPNRFKGPTKAHRRHEHLDLSSGIANPRTRFSAFSRWMVPRT